MGNEISLTKDYKENKNKVEKYESIKLISTVIGSDYQGVKTCFANSENLLDEIENEKLNNNISTECSLDILCDKELKIATKFEWNEGGINVFVVGNFNNWSQWFIMEKNNDNSFHLTLDLPLGSYQYKFIVDNVWRYSKNKPTVKDHSGNINNIIDNSNNLEDLLYIKKPSDDDEAEEIEGNFSSNFEMSKRKRNKKRNKRNKFINRFQKNNSSFSSNESPKIEDSTNEDYGSFYFPAKEDMNEDANNAPRCYTRAYNLKNYHVVDYKSSKFQYVQDNYLLNTYGNANTSYQKTSNLPPHITVNHISSSISSGNTLNSNNILTISSTFKAKNKFYTVLYYKPIN